MELADKRCLACHAGMPVLSRSEAALLLDRLNDWTIENGKYLSRSFSFKNFAQALELANRIGALAEKEGHHPDLLVRWGMLKVTLWTHAVNDLTESDFILAAKIDRLTQGLAKKLPAGKKGKNEDQE
jgi:4a-hydroxytetrahydrobiopterin dehydratase